MAGTKMAKSTGNIARVGEVVESGVSPRRCAWRCCPCTTGRDSNHSADSLDAAGAALERLDTIVAGLGAYAGTGSDDAALPAVLDMARSAFAAALDDDLNISAALAVVFDLVRDLNRRIERRSLSTAGRDPLARRAP